MTLNQYNLYFKYYKPFSVLTPLNVEKLAIKDQKSYNTINK